jgi:hypothetical protein
MQVRRQKRKPAMSQRYIALHNLGAQQLLPPPQQPRSTNQTSYYDSTSLFEPYEDPYNLPSIPKEQRSPNAHSANPPTQALQNRPPKYTDTPNLILSPGRQSIIHYPPLPSFLCRI